MTEFDSKKKLKEAKIDYTWYNQQIEQKLPLLYKFLGICYKLDVYGDDNLIKNECAKWGMTFADKPNFSSQTDQSTGEVSISLIEANLTKRSSTSCGKSLSKFGRIAGLT